MPIPIIYIHFGDNKELEDSLKIARHTNLDSEIVLLGDSTNKKYRTSLNISFIPYEKYSSASSVSFITTFQYIRGGVNYGKNPPAKYKSRSEFELFCFLRWFYLYGYMKEYNLSSVWYFDSDTWILKDLTKLETDFMGYDCMEMKSNGPAKGFITRNFLEKYIQTTQNIFRDQKYINSMLDQTSCHPDYTLCDMSAYYKCREEHQLRIASPTLKEKKIIFDEALLLTDDSCSRYSYILGRDIKKLTFIDKQTFICAQKERHLYELAVMNTSWLPDFYRNMLQSRIGYSSNHSIIRYILFAAAYISLRRSKMIIKYVLGKIIRNKYIN